MRWTSKFGSVSNVDRFSHAQLFAHHQLKVFSTFLTISGILTARIGTPQLVIASGLPSTVAPNTQFIGVTISGPPPATTLNVQTPCVLSSVASWAGTVSVKGSDRLTFGLARPIGSGPWLVGTSISSVAGSIQVSAGAGLLLANVRILADSELRINGTDVTSAAFVASGTTIAAGGKLVFGRSLYLFSGAVISGLGALEFEDGAMIAAPQISWNPATISTSDSLLIAHRSLLAALS